MACLPSVPSANAWHSVPNQPDHLQLIDCQDDCIHILHMLRVGDFSLFGNKQSQIFPNDTQENTAESLGLNSPAHLAKPIQLVIYKQVHCKRIPSMCGNTKRLLKLARCLRPRKSTGSPSLEPFTKRCDTRACSVLVCPQEQPKPPTSFTWEEASAVAAQVRWSQVEAAGKEPQLPSTLRGAAPP